MSRRFYKFNSLPLGWKITLGVLGAVAIFVAVVSVVSLAQGQSVAEGFRTLFGVAEKAVEELPEIEQGAEQVATTMASIGL